MPTYDGKEVKSTEVVKLQALDLDALRFLRDELNSKRDTERIALAKLELRIAAVKKEISIRENLAT